MPNHSVLCGHFAGPTSLQLLRVWRQPLSLPWNDINLEQWHEDVSQRYRNYHWTSDTSTDFEDWSHRVEHSLQGHVQNDSGRLPRGCQGRGRKNPLTVSLPQIPVPKPARPGEPALQNSLCSRAVQLWYKQLRRLGALLHGLRNGAITAGAATYQCQCWRSIRRAQGFYEGFHAWWGRRAIQLQGSPICSSTLVS